MEELLDKRAGSILIDELHDVEWDIRINSMEEAMKRLDRWGLFESEEERKNVVINVEMAPHDGSEYERALRLNSAVSLLSEYIECLKFDEYLEQYIYESNVFIFT